MLAEHLARAFEEEMADVRNRLEADDDRALVDWLRSRKKDGTAFLLAVDQFEELFTFADPDARATDENFSTCTINLSRFNHLNHPRKRNSAVFYPWLRCVVEGDRR